MIFGEYHGRSRKAIKFDSQAKGIRNFLQRKMIGLNFHVILIASTGRSDFYFQTVILTSNKFQHLFKIFYITKILFPNT
jgi:hypothetical protein